LLLSLFALFGLSRIQNILVSLRLRSLPESSDVWNSTTRKYDHANTRCRKFIEAYKAKHGVYIGHLCKYLFADHASTEQGQHNKTIASHCILNKLMFKDERRWSLVGILVVSNRRLPSFRTSLSSGPSLEKGSIRGHVFIIDLIRCFRACNIPVNLRRVLQKQHNKSKVDIAWCLTCLVLRFYGLSFVCMEIK
jgi:hypothetical protein